MIWRLSAAAVMAVAATAAHGQSINRELTRYQLRQADCADAHARGVAAARTDPRRRAAADQRRDRCLQAAERRYRHALRVQLRLPDRTD